MEPKDIRERISEKELVFATSRSGGPGGQNVNKVSTKVELRFNISLTPVFTEQERELLLRKLKNKINKEGDLILVSQSERTQLLNKESVIRKFYELVSKALKVSKKRRPTKPTLASRKKRLNEKKNLGLKKKLRHINDLEP